MKQATSTGLYSSLRRTTSFQSNEAITYSKTVRVRNTDGVGPYQDFTCEQGPFQASRHLNQALQSRRTPIQGVKEDPQDFLQR